MRIPLGAICALLLGAAIGFTAGRNYDKNKDAVIDRLQEQLRLAEAKNERLVDSINDIRACVIEGTMKKAVIVEKWAWVQGALYAILL